MNVSLSPEIERFIHSQVQSGKYGSTAEVIQAGIRLLEERENTTANLSLRYKERFEELRQDVLIGVKQLDRGERLDGRVVIEQLRQKNQGQNQVQ